MSKKSLPIITKMESRVTESKEPVTYGLDLSEDRKVHVVKEPDGNFVLNFRKFEGAIRIDSTWRISPEATQALLQLLVMHGLSVQPIAMTMEIPPMTWKLAKQPVKAKKAKSPAKQRGH